MLTQIKSVVVYLALYLVFSVMAFVIFLIIASAVITSGTNNELGRAGEGIFAVVVGFQLSFFVISPTLFLLYFLYKGNKKRKHKVGVS